MKRPVLNEQIVTCHPEKNSRIEIERMKNEILKNMVEMKRISAWNATAYNGRFGVMAAVRPQKLLCGNERLYPAGSLVGAATTPSRWDVSRHWRTAQRDNQKYKQFKTK